MTYNIKNKPKGYKIEKINSFYINIIFIPATP